MNLWILNWCEGYFKDLTKKECLQLNSIIEKQLSQSIFVVHSLIAFGGSSLNRFKAFNVH